MQKNLGNFRYLFSIKNTRNFYKNRRYRIKFWENFEEIHFRRNLLKISDEVLIYGEFYDISKKCRSSFDGSK